MNGNADSSPAPGLLVRLGLRLRLLVRASQAAVQHLPSLVGKINERVVEGIDDKRVGCAERGDPVLAD